MRLCTEGAVKENAMLMRKRETNINLEVILGHEPYAVRCFDDTVGCGA
jgi:hypothetical protein